MWETRKEENRENGIIEKKKKKKAFYSTATHSPRHLQIFTCLEYDLIKCLKTYVLVKSALKFSVHHRQHRSNSSRSSENADSYGDDTFFLNTSFKRVNLINPRKQVSKVSENQRKKGNRESCSRTNPKANTSC